MSARAFKSIPTYPPEAQIVALATQLLEDHAASREAATKAANLVCGACQGGKTCHSEIAGGVVECWACGGTGAANDKITSLPALAAPDHERLYQLMQLLKGPHGTAVLAVVREYMPDLFRADGAVN